MAAAANWPQMSGEDFSTMPKTLKTVNREPTSLHVNCRSDGRIVGHVDDEPLHGAVNPGAVFHRVFQAWQYHPLSEGHRGVDVRPKMTLCVAHHPV